MGDPQQTSIPGARRAAVWRRYLRFWGPRAVADVEDELRFHFEMRVRDHVARGLSEAAARDAVLRRLGDLRAARGECLTITIRRERRMARAQVVDAFVQDVRFALRTLGRQRGWTAVAVSTLALGIGANTAVFSVVSSLLLHALPYPAADRIAIIFQQPNQGNTTGMRVMVSPRSSLVKAWRSDAHSFEDIESYRTTDLALRTGGTPATLHAALVLPGFPRFAGQRPLIGRPFSSEDVASGGRVALLSEPLWRGRFGSDPRVIGTTLMLDDSLYTVIGVLPAALQLPRITENPTDIWLPLDLRAKTIGLYTIGRLRPGVSRARAQAELDSIAVRSDEADKSDAPFTTRLAAPREMVSFHDSLVLLMAAVGLVLLIACANVAHLLLARAATRQRELAIRAALGAGGVRLFRQLLTESCVLAAAGCVGGVALGWAGLRALVALRPAGLSELRVAHLDITTLLLTVGIAAITGIAFGVIGAFDAARHAPQDVLKAGALTTSHARGRGRFRSLLVVSEMALSAVLLVGATLLVRSVVHLQRTDPGFQAAGLYAVQPSITEARYPTPAARRAFYTELARRARGIPGVRGVALASGVPPTRYFLIGALQREGDADPPAGTTGFIDYAGVQPDFFRLMEIRLVQGTTFTDTSEAAHQVIVNEGLARKFWPGGSALGHRLRVAFNGQGDWLTVVGVAADAQMGGLTTEASAPMLYAPVSYDSHPLLLVRAAPGAARLAALRELVQTTDRYLAPPDVVDVEMWMQSSIAGPRFTMLLLTVFTALALVLAEVGLYGVLAYAVAQRTREIGIRIALGATRRNIARLVLLEGALLAATGIVIGLVGAHWATRLIQKMLYGVEQSDPISFATGTLLLLVIALLACIVPTRRAVAVDPAVSMRAD